MLFLPGTLPYFPLFPHLSLSSPRPPLLLPLVFPWALQADGSFLRQVAVFPPFQKAFYQPCSTQSPSPSSQFGAFINPRLIPSAQRLVWAAKQPLGKAALGVKPQVIKRFIIIAQALRGA